MSNHKEPRDIVSAYMLAFKKGVAGAVRPEIWSQSALLEHLNRGYTDGQKAAGDAWKAELHRLGVSRIEAMRWMLR